jgi:hypothetical protein
VVWWGRALTVDGTVAQPAGEWMRRAGVSVAGGLVGWAAGLAAREYRPIRPTA